MNSFPYIIAELDDSDDNLILFGHNPAFTEIPDRLSSSGCDFMPKTGIVSLVFNVSSWKDTMRQKGRIEFFLNLKKTNEQNIYTKRDKLAFIQ
jgi:phosphohistidine phosphatase SixA